MEKKLFSLVCLFILVANAQGENGYRAFPNWPPKRVRWVVDFSPKRWNVNMSFSMLLAGPGAGMPMPFLFASPFMGRDTYRFTYDFVDDNQWQQNLVNYFGRMTPSRPSAEQVNAQRQDYAAFKAEPWRFPKYLGRYRSLPAEVTTKLLEHERDVLLAQLYTVAESDVLKESEAFAGIYPEFVKQARTLAWPVEKVMSRLFLHFNNQREVFYWDGPIGAEAMRLISSPSEYEAFLFSAKEALSEIRIQREKESLKETRKEEFTEALRTWVYQERALLAFSRWFNSEWAKLQNKVQNRADRDKYALKMPQFLAHDAKFVDLIEHLSLEFDAEEFLDSELAALGRAPDAAFPKNRRLKENFEAYLNERYPALVYQAGRIMLAETIELAVREMDSYLCERKDTAKKKAALWLGRQKELARLAKNQRAEEPHPNPEEFVRTELKKFDDEYIQWEWKVLQVIRQDPSMIEDLKEKIAKARKT